MLNIGFLYIITYFVSGLAGSLLHALSTIIIPVWGPILADIPSLGASGAIFGLIWKPNVPYWRFSCRSCNSGYFQGGQAILAEKKILKKFFFLY